jgi:hypothetical protein
MKPDYKDNGQRIHSNVSAERVLTRAVPPTGPPPPVSVGASGITSSPSHHSTMHHVQTLARVPQEAREMNLSPDH